MSNIKEQKIDIIFNGERLIVEQALLLNVLLQQRDVVTGRFVVVINDEIVPKSMYETTPLKQGDHCEVMSPISGG